MKNSLTKTKALVSAAALLLLTGCSAISSGQVTAKHYSPSYLQPVMQCVSYNKDGVCINYLTTYNRVPEKWKLDLATSDQTGWVYVSERTYEATEIGDWFNGD